MNELHKKAKQKINKKFNKNNNDNKLKAVHNRIRQMARA